MILIKLKDGQSVRGEYDSETEDTITVKIKLGHLLIDKKVILEQKEVIDCGMLPLGTFIKSNDGQIYIKIGMDQFRLIRNSSGGTAPGADVEYVNDGRVMECTEVFPEVFKED